VTVHSVSSKGGVVIPVELRKKYGLFPGAQVRIVDYGGVLAIIPALSAPEEGAGGILKPERKLTDSLLEEHRNER
jgi:bifunctional DNA-binding transcriptional regulator/antitoxin component of YhaV-PrlF toxin-antitoxin module